MSRVDHTFSALSIVDSNISMDRPVGRQFRAGALVDRLPEDLARKMPRYPALPAIRLGRLAVHQAVHGKGLGTFLLMDAMYRSTQNEIGWVSFMVDAKDDRTRDFYLQIGFQSFENIPNHLYMMRQDIELLFR